MFEEERKHYVQKLLAFQSRMGLSNHKMAEELYMSERTYCRFISCIPVQKELDLVLRVYQLSGKMMYEMTGAKIPRELENSQIYSLMTDENKALVDMIIKDIYENQLKQESKDAKKKERNQSP